MRRAWILLAVVLVAACGGGSSNKRLTHEQLVAKVDKLCADATTEVRQIPQASGSRLHQDERFAFHLLEIQAEFLQKVRKLRPPLSDEQLWKKALRYEEKLHAAWGRVHAAAARGNPRALHDAFEHLQAIAKNPYFKPLGMKGC